MSFGKLQLDILGRIKKDYENFKKADSNRLKKINYLQTRMSLMNGLLESAEKYNEEIVGAGKLESDLKVSTLTSAYDEILDVYTDYKADVMDAIDKITPEPTSKGKNDSDQQTNSTNKRANQLKLPVVQPPTFFGGYEEWRTFRDIFVSLIHTNTLLTDVQKMNYLKSSVKGTPESIISHLHIEQGSYHRAWELLNDRYDHKRVLVNKQLHLFCSQPTHNHESVEIIKQIHDTSQEVTHSLKNLGLPVEQWDSILIFLMLQKLPKSTQQLWEEKLGSSKELPSLKEFMIFLQCRFRALEAVETQSSTSTSSRSKAGTNVFHAKEDQNRQTSCKVCKKGQHSLRECKKFLQMDVPQRKQTVYNIRVCENCLAYSHFKRNCPSTKSCYYCKQQHNTLLHLNHNNTFSKPTQLSSNLQNTPTQANYNRQNFNTDRQPSIPTQSYQGTAINPNAQEFQPSTISQPTHNFHIHTGVQVLLATALISVRASSGLFLTLRALIDPGSEASFMTEDAVQRLQLRTKRTFIEIHGLGRVSSGAAQKMVDVKIQSLTSTYASSMRALVLKSLTGLLPAQHIDLGKWSHLGGLQLADPTLHIPAKVDMLLGSDVYAEIILGGVVKRNDLVGPIAQRTHLGWIVMGKVPINGPSVRSFCSLLELNSTMRNFWVVEEEPYEKYEAEDDKLCEKHFQENTKRLPDGRYQVRLPFKGGELPKMGPTYQGAVKRFMQLEKKLESNPTLKTEYSKCMKEYIECGHMTPVDWSYVQLNTPFNFFIPHHAVIKESSTTTKLRVVFDATFKPFFGSSLNDKLMVGPKLQTNVIDIISRWRKYKFTFTGDVEKMYRQIRIDVPDSNFQLILWRDDPNQELKIFRLDTVTFGTSPAPFLALRVLLKLAEDEGVNYPLAKPILKEETYVDDVISGGDTVKETQSKLKAVRDLLATAGFKLRKHVSNTDEVLRFIPQDQRELDFSVPFEEMIGIKTLGIKWLPTLDVFSFQVAEIDNEDEITKRSILSSIAKLYDPMGWISPCIIKVKILMQQLWGRGLEWDKPIPEELKREWLTFRKDLPLIENVRIPRWVNTERNNVELEVHGFSDASEKAYSAAIYLRVLDDKGIVHMHLLMSKTKVAPLDTITLPRLELCGAVLLAKLINETTKVLNLDGASVWAWTDSVITLCWIRAPPSKWKTFISNRVSQIQKLTSGAFWRHIPSELNPADVASRGIFPSMILTHELWWKGPEFLRQQWNVPFPDQPPCMETQQEARSIKVHVCLASADNNNLIDDLINRISTLSKLNRVVAYCLRMRKYKKASKQYDEYLSPQEIQDALLKIIKTVQSTMFSTEEETTKGYHTLNPFKDIEGVLRVGGRLLNSDLPYAKKHPILLKPNHSLSKLIIADAHQKTFHGGNEKVIAYIRQRFWILNIKKAVKKHIHNCTICFRFRAQPLTQQMGNLPAARTRISRPFSFAGVDYAGPIDVKTWKGRNAKTLKGYFAIFVCMATKAVHIELVSDMTTEAFLGAFRRMVSRRGLCHELFSDCGRNFVGAEKELQDLMRQAKMDWKSVAETISNEGTKWNFIPPASPHFGGLWEAGVKSVKFHLKRVAGNQLLTFEELTTLLTQVEACLNSRPLCPQSDDINDYQPLTPGHFLVGEALLAPPQPEYQLERIAHLDRWKRVQAQVQSFWRKWSNEYLARLQQRPKWIRVVQPSIKEGDLVLMKDERLPPLRWCLARIIKLHPGPDGLTRVVTIKTASTELRRPITKICPLPSNTSN